MLRKVAEEQKNGAETPFFVLFVGYFGSYMLFRLANSDVIMHCHKYTIPNEATFSIVVDRLFIHQHQ